MRRQTDKKRKDRWTDASHPFYECQRLPLLLFSLRMSGVQAIRFLSAEYSDAIQFRRNERGRPDRFALPTIVRAPFENPLKRRKRVRAFRPTAPLHRSQSATNTSGSVWFLEYTLIVSAVPKNLLQFARQTLKRSIKQLAIQTKQKDALASLVFL